MGLLRYRNSFSLSLLLHAAVLALWMMISAQQFLRSPKPQTQLTWIEVDPIAPQAADQDKVNQRVVQTVKGDRTDKTVPNAFLGEQTQMVDRQTVSKNPLTMTPSQTAQASKPGKKEQSETSRTPKQATPVAAPALANLGVSMIPKEQNKQLSPTEEREQLAQQGSQGASAPSDYLKGFKEGEQTSLNTKEFVFYGYFQRIRKSLDLAWTKNLRERLSKIHYQGRSIASEAEHKTRVIVTLDGVGEVRRVQMVEESGTRDLDDAAVTAFKQAGPFPNPPRGLLNPDGEIQIRWEFILRT